MATPIVGADFLEKFRLQVDLTRRRLTHLEQGWAIPLTAPPAGSCFAAIGVGPQNPTPLLPRVEALQQQQQEPPALAKPPYVPPAVAAGAVRSLSASSSTSLPTVEALQQQQEPPAAAQPPYVPPAVTVGAARILSAKCCHVNYLDVLHSFPEVLNPSKKLPPVKHHVQYIIKTEGHAVAGKYCRLDPDRLEAAHVEIAELEKQGIVRRSKSHWASPLHMVKKSDGMWRPCGDFLRLNLQTTPDRYTCPNMVDLTARLAGCTVFSKLDLRKGYHQVPVKPKHVHKTAICTPFGLFEFIRMPFGLRNGGQTFQRLMDEIMCGLPFVFAYLDEVLIASHTHKEHVQHLQQVLTIFKQHGLVLNGVKCVLGASTVDYLGHKVTAEGISPLPGRVVAIKKFPQPATVQQLQKYLGMLNFYRRFIKGAMCVLKPLTDMLC